MATRNELEQEALRQTQRGDYSKAARIYHAILRQQPRDRRARQKLGEIYLKMGQKKEGAKYLKEVAGLSMREGQHRAAIALLRQLSELLPDDLEILGALAECYRESTQLHEAAKVYQTGLNMAASARSWEYAIAFASALVELQPTDITVQFRLAELREAAGDTDGALKDYRRMVATFQRRGELSEVARVAETALRLAAGDPDLLEAAIRARVSGGDFARALEVGGSLLASLDQQPPTLAEALAQALLRTGQEQRARNALLDIADRYHAVGDAVGQVRALRLALEAGADDPSLRDAISAAEARSEKLKKRLSAETLLSPANDEDIIACTRAEIQAQYGFSDRALVTLQAAHEARRGSYAVGARLVETLWDLGRRGEAIKLLESFTRIASGQCRTVLATRLLILGGPDLLPQAETAPTPQEAEDLLDEDTDETPPWERADGTGDDAEQAIAEDEELLDDDPGLPSPGDQDDPALDDIPATTAEEAEQRALAGDLDGAISLLQAAYREDPSDQELLMRIAELRRQQREERDQREAAPLAAPFEEEGADSEGESPDFPEPPSRRRGADAAGAPMIAGIGRQAATTRPSAADPGRWQRLLGGSAAAEPEPEPASTEPDWMAGLPGATEPRPARAEPLAGGAEDAWALATLGRFGQALPAARATPGLAGRWIEARCLRGLGKAEEALGILSDALEEASEQDEVYPEALMLLAKLQAGQERYRAATRTARDLADNFPDWRPGEVAALLRGLSHAR